MDPDFRYMPKRELLKLDEYLTLARLCLSLGIEKVRVTGGEPSLYPQLISLMQGLRRLPGLRDLAITTNGSRLTDDVARSWRSAGLDRLTLSLDSLRQERIASITRSTAQLSDTIRAIHAAHRAGLAPIKVNAVIMRGINDDEVADFADFAREHNIDMRFIEYMPLDSSRAWKREDVVTADEMLDRIRQRHELVRVSDEREDSTSLNFTFGDSSPGRIGIIAPVSRPFCGACSRLRITADGKIRPCLFSTVEWDIKPLLRAGASDEELTNFIADSVWTKQRGHGIGSETFVQPERTMSAIGG